MEQRNSTYYRPPLFGNLRVMCAAALLVALSIVLGKYLAINLMESFRFSLENLPILLAGIFFGPIVGGAVGLVADLLGCVLVGYAINPFITAGAVLVGVLSGLTVRLSTRCGRPLRPIAVILAVAAAHIVGSMVVKSVGMAVYYATPLPALLWRVPIYIATGALEAPLLILLARSKVFMGELNRLLYRRKGRKAS